MRWWDRVRGKGRARVSDRRTFLSRLISRWMGQRELISELDFQSLVNAYRSWVYVCASRNATSVASVPLRLYVAKGFRGQKIKGYPTAKVDKAKETFLRSNPVLKRIPAVRKAVEFEEVLDHPFLDMLQSVNAFMNEFTLKELTELYLELTGNAYWYIVTDSLGTPTEIWPMPPQYVKILPDRERFVKGYLWRRGADEYTFDETEVIHFKFPNPMSYFYGRSPLAAVRDAYNINQNMAAYENSVFTNMGDLAGYYTTSDEISDEEFERIQQELRALQGVKAAGKVPLLDKGLEYKHFGFSPRELSFLQGRRWVKEEICNAFGQTLGLYDKEANRANSETATYLYMRDTIRPRCIRIEDKLNEKLIPRYDERLFIAFDNCVPEDKEFRLREIEMRLKTGYSSINQERQADNQEPVPWGDVPIMPLGVAPLGSAPPPKEEGKSSDAITKLTQEVIAGLEERFGLRVEGGGGHDHD